MKYPTCSFPIRSAVEVYRSIAHKAQNGESFSFVRLGDGEGLLLSLTASSPPADQRYIARHLGAQSDSPTVVSGLQKRLIEAIRNADIVGIRNDVVGVAFEASRFSLSDPAFLDAFNDRFKLRDAEKRIGFHGARRIALLHRFMSNYDLPPEKHVCSAWAHYELQKLGALFSLIDSQQRLGVISCRSELPALLEEAFGVGVRFRAVADRFDSIPEDQRPENFIAEMERVLSEEHVEFPGMLYLVGAGLYGKLFCDLIKAQGGIALDLGSLLDAWVGIPSRSIVYRSMFSEHDLATGVPVELRLPASRGGDQRPNSRFHV